MLGPGVAGTVDGIRLGAHDDDGVGVGDAPSLLLKVLWIGAATSDSSVGWYDGSLLLGE